MRAKRLGFGRWWEYGRFRCYYLLFRQTAYYLDHWPKVLVARLLNRFSRRCTRCWDTAHFWVRCRPWSAANPGCGFLDKKYCYKPDPLDLRVWWRRRRWR